MTLSLRAARLLAALIILVALGIAIGVQHVDAATLDAPTHVSRSPHAVHIVL